MLHEEEKQGAPSAVEIRLIEEGNRRPHEQNFWSSQKGGNTIPRDRCNIHRKSAKEHRTRAKAATYIPVNQRATTQALQPKNQPVYREEAKHTSEGLHQAFWGSLIFLKEPLGMRFWCEPSAYACKDLLACFGKNHRTRFTQLARFGGSPSSTFPAPNVASFLVCTMRRMPGAGCNFDFHDWGRCEVITSLCLSVGSNTTASLKSWAWARVCPFSEL